MSDFSLPLTRLVHENLSILMTFAFSRRPIERLIDEKFQGEWKYLRKGLFEVSEQRAEKACLELALFLRLLDDTEKLSDYLKQTGDPLQFGCLLERNGTETELRLRDVVNKIIHASRFRWDLTDEENPILVCEGSDSERWQYARINLVGLCAFCGGLVH